MRTIDLEHICELYEQYADDLKRVGEYQRAVTLAGNRRMVPQLDDLEAEITYLLIREARPRVVVELGSLHGWSTTWLLHGLRDNGTGSLHSFDLVRNAESNVPRELSGGRWEFVQGDIMTTYATAVLQPDYLFIDAAHSARFATWYLRAIIPTIRPGVPVSIHDVYHLPFTLPFHEGKVVIRWLKVHSASFFTCARSKDRTNYAALRSLRRELGIKALRGDGDNPMIYFQMPHPSR